MFWYASIWYRVIQDFQTQPENSAPLEVGGREMWPLKGEKDISFVSWFVPTAYPKLTLESLNNKSY